MRPASAFALGLLHGPAELLPVSSSAHARLFLRGLEPARRKELEVALHAGTLLVLGLPKPSRWLVAATIPPALAGLLFEKPIEERLGGPRAMAIGLVAGGLAMALADRTGSGTVHARACTVPDPVHGDAVLLGLAQAAALMPGVSRHGSALTILRARGHARAEAQALSREASKPVLLGAAVLKGLKVRDGLPTLAAAIAGSALGTLAARRAVPDDAPLWPFALYRAALAPIVWRHG
jgi:undecaprenyl-diphosphatase